MSVEDAFTYGLIAVGLAAAGVSCLGLLLARDAFDRIHFVGPSTLAAICIAAAVLVREGPSLIAVKGGLMVVVLLVGAPLVSHATARAGRIAEHGRWDLHEHERAEDQR